MKNIYRIIALLMISAALTGLCACTEAEKETYICRLAELDGELYIEPSFAENGAEIILSSDGKGSFSYGGKNGGIRWQQSGENLNLIVDNESHQAVLKDNIIYLKISDDLNALFFRDDLELYPEFLGKLPLPGSYYGWWEIKSSEGAMPVTWIDCCGKIYADELGLTMKLWDEDGLETEPMAEFRLQRDGDSLLSSDGYFWYTELKEGQWKIEPQEIAEGKSISFTGTAQGRDGKDFSYRVYLRPWGDDWEKFRTDDPDMLPFNFETWYLPLIDEEKPMPEAIDIK